MVKNVKIDGKRIRSDYELEVYNQITKLLPEGATVEYEPEKIPYTTTHVYVPDFKVTMPDGTVWYCEAKGNGLSFNAQARAKMVAVKAQNPDLDIRLVFYRDGKISGSKRKKDGSLYLQSLWAQRNNFTYAITKVLKEWFR